MTTEQHKQAAAWQDHSRQHKKLREAIKTFKEDAKRVINDENINDEGISDLAFPEAIGALNMLEKLEALMEEGEEN